MRQTIATIIDALKANPTMLLLALVNAAFLGAVLWIYNDQVTRQANLVKYFADHCWPHN